MKILLLWITSDFEDYLINKYIAEGVEIFSAQDMQEAQNKIEKKGITHIILNIDSKLEQGMEYIKEIQAQNNNQRKYFIIQTRKNEKEIIEKLISLGVVGFVFPRDELTVNHKKIQNILNKTTEINNQRKHFRIKPVPGDNLVLNFPIPNYPALVSGIITDISIGGVAFRLADPDEISLFRDGQVLEKVQIILNGKRALTRMQILRRGNVCAARFVDPAESFNSILSRFIFERL